MAGEGGVVLLRRQQSTKEGNEGQDGTFPEGGWSQWSSSGGKSTQQSNTKVTSMARNVLAMTVRAKSKAARGTVAGATRMTATRAVTAATATTTATMTPNGDEDNKDGNSKNNDKATTTLTATTEGVSVVNHAETIAVERISSSPRRQHCAHGCLVVTRFHRSCRFPGREVYSLLCMGIHKKSG